jgi:fumarate hydratase class II
VGTGLNTTEGYAQAIAEKTTQLDATLTTKRPCHRYNHKIFRIAFVHDIFRTMHSSLPEMAFLLSIQSVCD